MKWDNTDLRVGLLVFVALILAGVSFMWVGQVWGRNVAPLYTDVADVQGIQAESPIFLNGFNVGRVTDVAPRVDSTGLVFRVRMDIVWRLDNDAEMPLKRGLRARVVPPALDIGRGSIVLEMHPEPNAVALKPGDVIPSSIQGGTTNRMQLVVDSVGRDLRLVIGQVDKLVQSLSVTVASATATMKGANDMLASVNGQVPEIMKGVKTNLASADSLMKSLNAMTRATDFLDTNEPQLASAIANLDQASAVLNNLLREVSRRPIKALTGVRPPDLTANGDVKQAGASSNGKPKP